MTGFQGLDQQAMTQLAGQLDAQADRLNRITSRIEFLVSHSLEYWHGKARQEFDGAWHQHHKRSALAARDALHGLAQSVRNNASDQVHVSARTSDAAAAAGAFATSRGAGGGAGPAGCRDVRPREFLKLADDSYRAPSPITVDGHTWTPVGADQLRKLGVDPGDMRDEASGFAATLYRAEDGTYVLAYAGTTPDDIDGDWSNNLAGAIPAQLSRQTEEAVTLALTLDKTIDGDLVFTGHSLGGRLAAVASIATDRTATTFNAAGVSDSEFSYALMAGGKDGHLAQNMLKGAVQIATLGRLGDGPDLYVNERRALESRVTAYYGSNDVLTNFQQLTSAPNAVGQQVRITSSTLNPIKAHEPSDLSVGLPD